MQQAGLYTLVQHEVQQIINGYIQSDRINKYIDQYIVPPALGNRSGVLGAIALAAAAERVIGAIGTKAQTELMNDVS